MTKKIVFAAFFTLASLVFTVYFMCMTEDSPEQNHDPARSYQEARDAVMGEIMRAIAEALGKNAAPLERAAYQLGFRNGYEQGWSEATHRFQKLFDQQRPQPPVPIGPDLSAPVEQVEHDKGLRQRVLDYIRSNPGKRGFEIVSALSSDTRPINERTIRTVLYRLRTDDKIYLDEQRWFPYKEPPQ